MSICTGMANSRTLMRSSAPDGGHGNERRDQQHYPWHWLRVPSESVQRSAARAIMLDVITSYRSGNENKDTDGGGTSPEHGLNSGATNRRGSHKEQTELENDYETSIIATAVRIVRASSRLQCVVEVLLTILKDEVKKSIERDRGDRRFTARAYVRLLNKLHVLGCNGDDGQGLFIAATDSLKVDDFKENGRGVLLPFLVSICTQELAEIASCSSSIFISCTKQEIIRAIEHSESSTAVQSCSEALHALEDHRIENRNANTKKDREIHSIAIEAMISCLGQLMIVSNSSTKEDSSLSRILNAQLAFVNSISKAIVGNVCQPNSLTRSVLRVLSLKANFNETDCSRNGLIFVNCAYRQIVSSVLIGIGSCNLHDQESRTLACIAAADVADFLEQMSDKEYLHSLFSIVVSLCQNFQFVRASTKGLLHVALRLMRSCKIEVLSKHLVDIFSLLPDASHGESSMLLKLIYCMLDTTPEMLSHSSYQFLLQRASECAVSPTHEDQHHAPGILEKICISANNFAAMDMRSGNDCKASEWLPDENDLQNQTHVFGWPSLLNVTLRCINSSGIRTILEAVQRASDEASGEIGFSNSICSVLGFALTSETGNERVMGMVAKIISENHMYGPSLLPLAFLLTQRLKEAGHVLQLLKLMPIFAKHYSSSLTLERIVSKFDTSESTRALRLVLLTRLWEQTGRGINRLSSLIMRSDQLFKFSGEYAPKANQSDNESLELRIARIFCIKSICLMEPESAVEMVHAIDASLRDTCSVVRSLGLDSIYLLCNEGILDWSSALTYIKSSHSLTDTSCAQEIQAWIKMRKLLPEMDYDENLMSQNLNELLSIATDSAEMVLSNLHKARTAAAVALAESDLDSVTSKGKIEITSDQWSRLSLQLRNLCDDASANAFVKLLQEGMMREELKERRKSKIASGHVKDPLLLKQMKDVHKLQALLCEMALLDSEDTGTCNHKEAPSACILLSGLSPKCAKAIIARNGTRFSNKRALYAKALSTVCSGAEVLGLEKEYLERDSWDRFIESYLHILKLESKSDEAFETNVNSLQTKLERMATSASPMTAACAVIAMGSIVQKSGSLCEFPISKIASFLHSIIETENRELVRRACHTTTATLLSCNVGLRNLSATCRITLSSLLFDGDCKSESLASYIKSWTILADGLFSSDYVSDNGNETERLLWIMNSLTTVFETTGFRQRTIIAMTQTLMSTIAPSILEATSESPKFQHKVILNLEITESIISCVGSLFIATARRGSYQDVLVELWDLYINEIREILSMCGTGDNVWTLSVVESGMMSTFPSLLFCSIDYGFASVQVIQEMIGLILSKFKTQTTNFEGPLGPVLSALIDAALAYSMPLSIDIPQSIFDCCSNVMGVQGEADVRGKALATIGNLIGASVNVKPYICSREHKIIDAGATSIITQQIASSKILLSGPLVTQPSAASLVTSIVNTLSKYSKNEEDDRVRYLAGCLTMRALSTVALDIRESCRTDAVSDYDGSLQEDSAMVNILQNIMPKQSDKKVMSPEADSLCIKSSLRCLSVCKRIPLICWEAICLAIVEDFKHDKDLMNVLLNFILRQAESGKSLFISISSKIIRRCWQNESYGLQMAIAMNVRPLSAVVSEQESREAIDFLSKLDDSDLVLQLQISCASLIGRIPLSLSLNGNQDFKSFLLSSLMKMTKEFCCPIPHPSFGLLSSQMASTKFWESLLKELSLLETSVLPEILAAFNDVQATYLKCRLSVLGKISWTNVAACQMSCLENKKFGTIGILECSRALIRAPATVIRRKFLLDCLNAISLCKDPTFAIQCAYCIIISLSSIDLRALVESDPSLALDLLPHALHILLQQEEWNDSRETLILRLLRAMQLVSAPLNLTLSILASVRGLVSSDFHEKLDGFARTACHEVNRVLFHMSNGCES